MSQAKQGKAPKVCCYFSLEAWMVSQDLRTHIYTKGSYKMADISNCQHVAGRKEEHAQD